MSCSAAFHFLRYPDQGEQRGGRGDRERDGAPLEPAALEGGRRGQGTDAYMTSTLMELLTIGQYGRKIICKRHV